MYSEAMEKGFLEIDENTIESTISPKGLVARGLIPKLPFYGSDGTL